MNAKTIAATVLVTSAAVVVALSGFATASSTQAPVPAQNRPAVLHFVERGGALHVVDAPPKGAAEFNFSPGDVVIVTRDLYARSGAKQGSLRIVCTAISATVQQCLGSASLENGTIDFAGVSQAAPRTSVAVIGGTAAYAGVRGSTLAVDRPGPADVADLTITFVR
jgi:hypothetical protein